MCCRPPGNRFQPAGHVAATRRRAATRLHRTHRDRAVLSEGQPRRRLQRTIQGDVPRHGRRGIQTTRRVSQEATDGTGCVGLHYRRVARRQSLPDGPDDVPRSDGSGEAFRQGIVVERWTSTTAVATWPEYLAEGRKSADTSHENRVAFESCWAELRPSASSCGVARIIGARHTCVEDACVACHQPGFLLSTASACQIPIYIHCNFRLCSIVVRHSSSWRHEPRVTISRHRCCRLHVVLAITPVISTSFEGWRSRGVFIFFIPSCGKSARADWLWIPSFLPSFRKLTLWTPNSNWCLPTKTRYTWVV